MINPNWSDVTLTVGGVPLDVSNVSYTEKRDAGVAELRTAFYEATGSFQITAEAFHDLSDAIAGVLRARTRGASDATLARRVFYGGRKGRRALRRLYDRGYGGVAMSVAGPVLLPRGSASH